MWDGFELPGELVRHQLPAALDETVGGEPAALVGNSYGGFVALDFAARRPDLVEKLVLLDAPLMDHDFSPEFTDYVEEEERLLEAGDLHYTIAKTPIGLDVKVLQDGAAIARLRMAGRCDMRGQFSQCRFKKRSTAL
jgi:pimeloyl-ACP methyl ester carboxylesterase